MAKKRTKNHKFIKVKNMRNIISLCSDIKLYDQNILELFHQLRTIFKTSYFLLSPSFKRLKLKQLPTWARQQSNSITLLGMTHSTPKRLKIALQKFFCQFTMDKNMSYGFSTPLTHATQFHYYYYSLSQVIQSQNLTKSHRQHKKTLNGLSKYSSKEKMCTPQIR
jgi:hypothetical protein